MGGHVQVKIRELLRASDGMTIAELAVGAKRDAHTVRSALLAMPDTYVDRWVPAHNNLWAAVWSVVVPPENCPKPDSAKGTI